MGVEKIIDSEGDGASPKIGDKVTFEYTGWLKDITRFENKGIEQVPMPRIRRHLSRRLTICCI
jgi:FKBP-type peptidyl-prolyl cis-trans isomerase